MELSNLQPAQGATHKVKRIGRGQGSGHGGTSTRGHKGAQSRSGYSRKLGFEGGQMPLQRRLPKFGFKNINRVEYKAVNLATLQSLADENQLTKIDFETLVTARLVSKNALVKVLGDGLLTASLEISAHAFSKSAIKAIEEKGGKAIVL